MIRKCIFYLLSIFSLSGCVYFDYALLVEDAPDELVMSEKSEFETVLFSNNDIIPGLNIKVRHLEKSWSERKRKGNNWESNIYVEYVNGVKELEIIVTEKTLYHKDNNEIIPAVKSLTFWNSIDKYVYNNEKDISKSVILNPDVPRNFLSIKNIYNIEDPAKVLREFIELRIIADGETVETIVLKYDFNINYFKHYSIFDVWMSV